MAGWPGGQGCLATLRGKGPAAMLSLPATSSLLWAATTPLRSDLMPPSVSPTSMFKGAKVSSDIFPKWPPVPLTTHLSIAPPPSPQRSHRRQDLPTPHSTPDGARGCGGLFGVWGQALHCCERWEWRETGSLHPLWAPAPQCGPCGPSQRPRKEKRETKPVGPITLGLFFQELPPSNKPLGLPWGEQCRVRVRGGLQSGEQALGTPVFRRGRPQRRGAWRKGDKGENGCSALSTSQAWLGYVPTIWNKSSLSKGYFWHTLSSL